MFSLICRNCLLAKTLGRWMSLLTGKEDFKYYFIRKLIDPSNLYNMDTNTCIQSKRGKKESKLFALSWEAHRLLKKSMCLVLPLDRNFSRSGPQLPAISQTPLSSLLACCSLLHHTLASFYVLPHISDGQDEIQE